MIYLDNAATTWPKPESVYQAVDRCLRSLGGNPGRGAYGGSLAASQILYQAREELAQLFHIENPGTIIFTHNATDAINTALLGTLERGQRVVTTSMEHNAVARPLRYLESRGVEIIVLPCDRRGILDLERMETSLRRGADAVVVGHASNVTGAILPMIEIGKLARRYNARLIVDAAQTAGVEAINVDSMNIDLLAFSGHKGLLGPQGTGGLYVRDKVSVTPLRFGGTGSFSESDRQPDFMPDHLESGTPNTPGIAGLIAGLEFIKSTGRERICGKEKQLAAELRQQLQTIEGVTVYGTEGAQKCTAVLSFNLQGKDSGFVAQRLDREYGIACRAGLHCAPWAHKTLGTLQTGAIRFSPGYFNTEEEIAKTIDAVQIMSARVG